MIYQIKRINPIALNELYTWKSFVIEDSIVLTRCTVSLGTFRSLRRSYFLHLRGQVFQDF